MDAVDDEVQPPSPAGVRLEVEDEAVQQVFRQRPEDHPSTKTPATASTPRFSRPIASTRQIVTTGR